MAGCQSSTGHPEIYSGTSEIMKTIIQLQAIAKCRICVVYERQVAENRLGAAASLTVEVQAAMARDSEHAISVRDVEVGNAWSYGEEVKSAEQPAVDHDLRSF